MQVNKIPTGYLCVNEYSKGQLEFLSIGDYGKSKNIKADFLGYSRDLNGVPNGIIAPLQEKWVITLSTQYGCSMKCKFCDCPSIPFKGNATVDDLKNQLVDAINLFPEVKYTDRLNTHLARCGEPVANFLNVFNFCNWLADKRAFQSRTNLRVETIHPVFTTMVPKHSFCSDVIRDWAAEYKNGKFNGQAGLQLSINSTSDEQRNEMFSGMSKSLEEISKICEKLEDPLGRKYCLNFAYSDQFEIDARKLRNLFDPQKFMCKITPIHNNTACQKNSYQTTTGYESYKPYSKVEAELKAEGFDVLVFVPSMDEEDGLVTCGNLILSGRELKV
jgi:23S rRNA (adenine2503-C2)-methyltransferase